MMKRLLRHGRFCVTSHCGHRSHVFIIRREAMEQAKAKGSVSRRDFLKETAFVTAGAAALGGLAPARVMGANDRIRVAVLGCGERARYLASIFVKQPSVEIVEVC